MTLANRLTLLRIGLTFPYAVMALTGHVVIAAVIFAAAAVTDLLDGFVARQRQEETLLGKVLDPIADKMLALTALVVLVANGTLSEMELAAVLAIVLRETWVAGLREGLISAGGELPVTGYAKIKTTIQLLALFLLTLGITSLGVPLLWASVGLTLYTGWEYTVMAFKILNLGTGEAKDD
ncbi:MAG: CDP-alcohol phosphatidyltransferase family protein [Pseudomonadota bacterium]